VIGRDFLWRLHTLHYTSPQYSVPVRGSRMRLARPFDTTVLHELSEVGKPYMELLKRVKY
jgi:hypothetical protein